MRYIQKRVPFTGYPCPDLTESKSLHRYLYVDYRLAHHPFVQTLYTRKLLRRTLCDGEESGEMT